jgi:cell shape-determining protein MreC
MSNVTPLTPISPTPVRGKILEISGNLVTISVGSADGVKEGMVFMITRGDQYVGDLKISTVNPNQSAGRMVRTTLAPAQGDQVKDAR